MKRNVEENRRVEVLVREYGGILPYAEAFYIQSIVYDSERAEGAFSELEHALENSFPGAQAFAFMQQALTHSASVSRYFWPQRDGDVLSSARASKLKRAFRLSEDSSLATRKLRNALEHYDERLDAFMLEDHFGNLQPWPVIGRSDHTEQGTLHRFKLLDPDEQACVILGERFVYGPIRLEVRNVLARGLRFLRNGARLPTF